MNPNLRVDGDAPQAARHRRVSPEKIMIQQPEILAYLDHNVLNRILKGDPDNIKGLLKENNLRAVFSEENLKEIHRSKGYEQSFLNLLEDIGAKYIEPVVDSKSKLTGQAKIHTVKASTVYDNYLKNISGSFQGDFGLSEMLKKFYGGQQGKSFKEIVDSGADELKCHLSEALDDIDNMPALGEFNKEEVKEMINNLPEMIKSIYDPMVKDLDAKEDPPVKALEEKTGVGPKILNNIKPPQVVQQIWEIISKNINNSNLELETFFGIKAHHFEADAARVRTLQEKVNAIYHQLNFLGYYRDSDIKKERRFIASFSDMTHAGLASFCHVFICSDNNLVMKTAAAYEYLGVRTKIHYLQNESDSQKPPEIAV